MALSSLFSSRLPLATLFISSALALMNDGCVHMPVIHSAKTPTVSKRAIELQLANFSDIAYYAMLDIGTPSQSQYVQLDTGSFELWVNPECVGSGLALGDMSFCEQLGNYRPSDSSTSKDLHSTKTLAYGIGEANITYFKDDISMPNSSSVLQQVQFGVASTSKEEFSGILGIGYGQGYTTNYPNFVDQLADQNVTLVKAFSLALGSLADGEGSIVFGGVDTSKFAGPLSRLPIIPADQSPDGVPRYWIHMAGMTLSPPPANGTAGTVGASSLTNYANSSIPVFLDSGSTLTLLPASLVGSIALDLGALSAEPNPQSGYYAVDCGLLDQPGTLDFHFPVAGDADNVTVSVPYAELIRSDGSRPPQCALGIESSDTFTLLGDTFLRSAYATFDLETNSIWMAQYTNCGSTPAALGSISALTTLTGDCNAQSAAEINGGGGASSSSISATGSAAAAAATTKGSSASSSGSAKAGGTDASSGAAAAAGRVGGGGAVLRSVGVAALALLACLVG